MLSDHMTSRPVSVVMPVLSSLTGAVKNYLEGVFPRGYFKDYNVDSEMPLLRRRRNFRPMSASQLANRRLPMMSVRVETTADSSDFSSGVSWWTGNRFLREATQLFPLIHDDSGLRYVGFHTDRIVVRFQVSFVLETDFKAREILMYLKRVLPVGQRVFLNGVHVNTEMPGDILREIWRDLGLTDGSDPAQVTTFHNYLRSVTAGDVEKTINSASGRAAFSFAYPTNPVMTISSTPTMSLNRDGNVIRSSQVDIPIELDLPVPMSYAYQQEAKIEPTAADLDLDSYIGGDGKAYFGTAIAIRPASTIENRTLSFFASIVTGEHDPEHPGVADVTDLSAHIPQDVQDYVDYLLTLPGGESMVQVMVWRGPDLLPESYWDMTVPGWNLTVQREGLYYRHKYFVGIYCDLQAYRRLHMNPSGRPQAPSPYYFAK